jgi:tetratricopeptide (TPR) repeat protein
MMRSSKLFAALLSFALVLAPIEAQAQSVDQLFEQGSAASAAGNSTQAEAIWRKVIRLAPDNPFAYYNLAIELAKQNRSRDAIVAFQKVLTLPNRPGKPTSSHVLGYTGLGGALADMEQFDRAIAAYRQAIQLDPTFDDAYYSMSLAQQQKGQTNEAILNLRRTLKLNPDKVDAHIWLGILLRTQGKLAEATASLRRATELDSTSTWIYTSLGDVLLAQGKTEEAIKNYQIALNLPERSGLIGSAHTATYNSLGLALQRQGKLKEAIEAFQSAIDLNANYAAAQNNLREAQRLLKQQQQNQKLLPI